jgi:hypothetical protein
MVVAWNRQSIGIGDNTHDLNATHRSHLIRSEKPALP